MDTDRRSGNSLSSETEPQLPLKVSHSFKIKKEIFQSMFEMGLKHAKQQNEED